MRLAPIILFVYNRPHHTRGTIEALMRNKLAGESELFIFSDAAKNKEDERNVELVRDYIDQVKEFRKIYITKREKNLGLANSVITGVSEVIRQYGKVIVLEDDLITSSSFLFFMNQMLDQYENEKLIYSVTGYNLPKNIMKIPAGYPFDIYFNPRPGSWSWGTWSDRWERVDWEIKDFNSFKGRKDLQKKFNFSGEDKTEMLFKQIEGEIDSWAIRWDYHLFKNDALCIYPVKSYVNNIGHDRSGVHSGLSRKYEHQELNNSKNTRLPNRIELNEILIKNFRKVYHVDPLKKYFFYLLKKIHLFEVYRKLRHSI